MKIGHILLVFLLSFSESFATRSSEREEAARLLRTIGTLCDRTSDTSTRAALGLCPGDFLVGSAGVGMRATPPLMRLSSGALSWIIDSEGHIHEAVESPAIKAEDYVPAKLRIVLGRLSLPPEKIWELGLVRDRGGSVRLVDVPRAYAHVLAEATPMQFYAAAAERDYARGWNSMGMVLASENLSHATYCFGQAVDRGYLDAVANWTAFLCRAERNQDVFELWDTLRPEVRIKAVTNFVTAGLNVLRDFVATYPSDEALQPMLRKVAQMYVDGLHERPLPQGIVLLWNTQPALNCMFRDPSLITADLDRLSREGCVDHSGLILGGAELLSHRDEDRSAGASAAGAESGDDSP